MQTQLQNIINKYHVDTVIGCYDDRLDNLKPSQLKRLEEAIEYGENTDLTIILNRKKHTVEIEYWDNEIDFMVKTQKEYNEVYG